jgi:type IV pilus assembly protein PilQ
MNEIMKSRTAGQHDVRLWRLAVALWAAWSLFGASASSGAQPTNQVTETASPAPHSEVRGPAPKLQEPAGEPEQAPLRERLRKKISVDFRKTPIEDVIRIITEQADVDVVTSPNVKGETTVKLTNVALEEALRSILEVHGFDYVVGNNIIKILPRNEMPQVPERLATQVFDITYADVNDVVKSLEKFKSETGSVSHIRGTSQILITDKESKVQDIAAFISQVDRMTPQILVEARIYDITSKDNFDLGVQWSAGTRTSVNAIGEPNGLRTDPFTVANFNGTTSKAGRTSAGLRFGWLTSHVDIDVLLKAQNEKIHAKLLANPRVLVLNDQTATMKIVSEIPYQELTESALGGSIGTTAFREVGVELHVTAHLAARDQMVRLQLKPVFSVVTGQVQVAGASGQPFAQPVVDRRETDTTLIVGNGRTIVMGGLRKKEVTRQINKVPLLGDLPLAGALFRFKGEQTVNSELIVFVTPWIVEQPTLSETESQAYEETRFEGPRPAHTDAEAAPN